jgi:transcription-repair coupling factor (superfamily II helicase)
MITLFLNEVEKKLSALSSWKTLLARTAEARFPFTVYGPQGSFLALAIRAVHSKHPGPLLVVVPTEQEAESLRADLELFQVPARLFPWWGTARIKKPPQRLRFLDKGSEY